MTDIAALLKDEAEYLLDHKCSTITKDQLHLPGGDYIDRVMSTTDRPIR